MIWNKENIDLLKEMLQAGESSRQICKKLSCSLDSISGAIRRYNLSQYRTIPQSSVKCIQSVDMESLDEVNFEQQKQNAKLQWVPVKTQIKVNKKVDFETILVFGDTHIPHQNDAAINAVLKLMDDIKFDRHVNLGDFLDFGCISHWNLGRNKTLEMQRLKNDYIKGNVLLDEVDKRLPKGCIKYFLKGNHCVWVDDLLEKTPQLQGLIEPEINLKLIERGYTIYPYNDIVPLGKLNLTHGIYAGANPVKKHLDELKVNIMFGHSHTMATMMSSSAAREIAFSGYNVGCLADLCPDYMKNKPSGWTHGIAIVYLYENGYFEVNMIRIINGKFIYNGKIYDGNKR